MSVIFTVLLIASIVSWNSLGNIEVTYTGSEKEKEYVDIMSSKTVSIKQTLYKLEEYSDLNTNEDILGFTNTISELKPYVKEIYTVPYTSFYGNSLYPNNIDKKIR